MMIQSDGTVRAAGILLMLRAPQQQFLLLRHSDRWDLPKGHCEPGESFLETALRETEEETGIGTNEIAIDQSFQYEISYPVTYQSRGGQTFLKTVRYFLGYLASKPALTLTEHQSSQWFDWNPPHRIQSQTIDPLLEAVARHHGEN
ncbi:dihydroneopterin triphosphate pyrophosphatase [Novipirellula aureliae]|uniref:Bis(5'-nucleosyl)-tetraphosphatase [asymmetrical] n=1 Tax=Novipirellula aureliae TaxID=2527966 RepID=A0A5C6DJN1_9BACT|nr:NUDIX domain-containing protein [Novipirellula aureliae]TWU35791.1 dihydroneopterin triphosphate pyrophosphatase [Novipirellula aureliae]